jgi:hypothetical protein
MSDVFNAIELQAGDASKVLKKLEAISEAQSNSPELTSAVHAAMEAFRSFFLSYGEPTFSAHTLHRNQTAESAIYNENIESLSNDIDTAYNMLRSTADGALTSYNYASIISDEIKNAASSAASTVLDLSILSDFVKGTTIIAGDDFINSNKLDFDFPVDTNFVNVINGASAVGLKPTSIKVVSHPDVKIGITPVMPANPGGNVNTQPTPDNLERFYEGKFFAPIGQQNPEGGNLQITYIVDTTTSPVDSVVTTVNGKEVEPELNENIEKNNDTGFGYYAIVQSSAAEKAEIRKRMVDGNADTWWECEYAYRVQPLIDFDIVAEEDDSSGAAVGQGGQIQISLQAAEELAKAYDYAGRDLMIHIDYDFGVASPMNFVTIDPVLVGTQAFTEVVDVATLNSDGEFETVEGFDSQQFDKVLTPEANKAIDDDLVATTLAPSKFAYGGLGVFSFPLRVSNKLRVTLLMRDPVPAPYERQYVLTQEIFTDTTTVKTTKKSLW